jgi:hypothetical protein
MSYLNPILNLEKKRTRQRAIKAMCAHCMGCTRDHIEQGFRECIRNCTSVNCPLHFYRPYQVKESDNADSNSARKVS